MKLSVAKLVRKTKRNLSNYKQFVYGLFKNPFKVGALAPSSKHLSHIITEMGNLTSINCVVELGPGTGVFTERILKKIKPETCFFCLENNSHFVKETMKRCPEAVVYHSCAERIQDFLLHHQQDSCDVVISSIPWTIFDNASQENLLNRIYDALGPEGELLTYMYLLGIYLPGGINFRKKIKNKFTAVSRSKIIWKNFPPVFIYRCKK